MQGYAYASRHRDRAAYQWSIDVSVYVRADAHRRGIGRALYAALLRIVVAQGFYNAYAGITLPNPASVGLHESFGFRPVGMYRRVGHKLGAWHDVGWWALDLQPRPASPAAGARGRYAAGDGGMAGRHGGGPVVAAGMKSVHSGCGPLSGSGASRYAGERPDQRGGRS